MRGAGVLRLAWRHVCHERARSLILVACLTLTLARPLAVHRRGEHYGAALPARAEATPLIVGAKGNRFDLVLKSLYFDAAYGDHVTMADAEVVRERGYGRAIPLHLRYTAHRLIDGDIGDVGDVASAAVVGTTLAYLDFRGLRVAEGSTPLFLGDAVVGARAATRLRVGVGDAVLSDPVSAYDPARSFQLRMPVVGVLAEAGTPDDDAIFVDLKTAWVIDGIGHGHDDLRRTEDPALVDLGRSGPENVVATARLVEYQEITPENRRTFHFHGDPAGFPVTSIILLPRDDRMRTIAGGWYNVRETRELLVPEEVIGELLGLVFQVRRFFDANFVVVGLTTGLLVGLVLLLSHRLRRAEFLTLHKIGCARATVFWLEAVELAMLLGASVALALAGSLLFVHAAPWLFRALPS